MVASDPAALGAPGTIEIRGLRAVALCGVLPEERQRAQPIEIDLDLGVDLGAASQSDDLADTVDYGLVTERVAHLVAESSFQLLEALAQAIAAVVLETDKRIEVVTVAVRKLRPPLALDMATVGVRTLRRRTP